MHGRRLNTEGHVFSVVGTGSESLRANIGKIYLLATQREEQLRGRE
jgi:hypothetical protein